MTVRRTVIAGVVAWLVFLVASLPADRALALAPPMPAIALGSVQGTLWRGQVSRVVIEGMQLERVHWTFKPLSILTGRFELDFKGESEGKPVHALAGRTFFGDTYLRDVQASIPASEMLYRSGVKGMTVTGHLSLDLDDVYFSPTGMPMFSGQVSWTPAEVEAPLVLSLGTATLTTQHNGVLTEGKLETRGGMLLVQADVTLEASGAYRLDAMIRPNGAVPQAVTKFLTTFAENENGSYRLEWSDTLR